MKDSSLLSLQNAFDSTFHHKFEFNDFCQLDVVKEFTKLPTQRKLIFNPSSKLKKYHRFLNSFVFDYAKVNTDVVHSYRRGKNTFTAVIKHADSKYFFQTDIKDFFYSITSQDIVNVFDENLSNVPICDIDKYKDHLVNMVTVNNMLPVGFSTSPSISNTCLYAFDNDLEEYCLKKGVIYTRYSDDIILSSNESNLYIIQDFISEKLSQYFNNRLQLNPNKTKHTHKGKKIKLLGLVILPSGKVSVDMKVKKRLEIALYFYINDKEKFYDFLSKQYDSNLSTISGQLCYINSIDKSYLDKLRKKYGNYIVDIFFHKTVKNDQI